MADVDWARVAPPYEFFDEEMADDFARAVLRAHDKVANVSACFASDADEAVRFQWLGRVKSVVDSSFVEVMGCRPADRFTDIFDQISFFASHLALDHIFPDGNKRTTLVVSVAACEAMGNVDLHFLDDPDPNFNLLYGWIGSVVSREKTEGELAEVIRTIASPKKN